MADGQNVEIVSPAVGQKQNRIGTGKAEFSDYCAFRCQIVFNQRDNRSISSPRPETLGICTSFKMFSISSSMFSLVDDGNESLFHLLTAAQVLKRVVDGGVGNAHVADAKHRPSVFL